MPNNAQNFIAEHRTLSRRHLLAMGVAGATALARLPLLAAENSNNKQLQAAIDRLEPFFTKQDDFYDVSRGTPKPHSLSLARKKQVGLTRDTWKLEVTSDPENPTRMRTPLSKQAGNALDFAGLMELAKTKAVRFSKVMTCLNLKDPLGQGVWEGVPLRDVLWLTQPTSNLRRVFYWGFHNYVPSQIFRSSLDVGRVLEDPYDLPPVILCYKLNGEWLTPKRGAPVRMIVPEAYGFKSVKWITNIVATNLAHANDTYANANNDIASPLKTVAGFLGAPQQVKAGEAIPVTGYAQAGQGGLSKVQVWMQPADEENPDDDKWFSKAPWRDAEILGPPKAWGGDLPEGKIPANTHGFDESGKPKSWPLRYNRAHWAALLPGLPRGEYILRCRSIDEKGIAQPMPRPFRKSGHASIPQVEVTVR